MSTLTWSAFPGQRYQVRYTTNLAGTNWQALGAGLMATNTTVTTTDILGPDSQRFHQIAPALLQNSTDRSISDKFRRPDSAMAISNSLRKMATTRATPPAPPDPRP